MRTPSRISTRKDRAGTARSPAGEAGRGKGGGVGRVSGGLRGSNAAKLYRRDRSWSSVRELLDSARNPPGRRNRASKETRAVNEDPNRTREIVPGRVPPRS